MQLRSFAGKKPCAKVSVAAELAATITAASQGAEESRAAPGAHGEQAAGRGDGARPR